MAQEQVQVDCPQLSPEQTAEVEARVRASLLTADIRATVRVTCESERAGVTITSNSGESATETFALSANLREELLEALDRALQKLTAPSNIDAAPTAPAESAPEEAAPTDPTPAEPIATTPPPTPASDRVAPTSESSTAMGPRAPLLLRHASAPLFANAVTELWSLRVAGGAELGTEWAFGTLRYAARAGVLTPFKSDPEFRLLEWEGLAHVAGRPRALFGVQLTLGLGVGFMTVSPRGAAVSRETAIDSAFFGFVAASRTFRIGHFGLVPELGTRFFPVERGVRVDAVERANFGWFAPRLSLGVAYID